MAFKGDVGGVMPDKESSRAQNTAVGGGTKPNQSKINIPTSAPTAAHTLGRAASNWLK
jgi:hypothetical protein